ncbi:MAG: LPS assembly lipoprotein LptE [Candidatus Thioglobus sp.]|jgi:Rare lipoprotein B family.
MSKINLLSIILITSLLSACGFHTPYKNTPLNASITSTDNNAFTLELRKRFNSEATQSLAIQVGDEVQKKQTSSYNSSGKTSSYTLSLSVPVKVFNNDNKLLLSQNLTASTHLSKMSATQADRLQIAESYEQLRNTIIKKLLRRLNRLNEN